MSERIDEGDMAFHARAVEEVKAAQMAEQQIAALQQQIIAANGVMRSWSRHLAEKYKLGSNDGVDENGNIHRAAC